MTPNVKKILTWLLIGFVGFYLISNPDDAAGAVRGAGEVVLDLFESMGSFINSVFAA